MSRVARSENGFTLTEVLIALAIFSLVVISVDGSVTVLSKQAIGLSQSSQAIDQLQVAEQTVVRDVHAATSWTTLPSTVATTLTTAVGVNTTPGVLHVASVQRATAVGDTVVVGSGGTLDPADTFVAASPASVGATSITVTGTSVNAHPIGDPAYDTATVSLNFTAALDGTSLSSALTAGTSSTSLSVAAVAHTVHTGDTIVVGSGGTTDSFVAATPGAPAGATSIPVTSHAPTNGYPAGSPVYDSNTTITLTTNADSSRTLNVTTNGIASITLANLDPSSGFTWTKVTVGGTDYYVAAGVTLTMDSPRVGAPRVVKTSVADPVVGAWNVEYPCTAASVANSTGPLNGAPC